MAERRRTVDEPEIVGDDAVDNEEDAEGELGEESAAADAKEGLGVAELGHRPRQVFVVRQVHAASGEQRRVQYNNRPTQELRIAELGKRNPEFQSARVLLESALRVPHSALVEHARRHAVAGHRPGDRPGARGHPCARPDAAPACPGATRTAIGITGNIGAVDPGALRSAARRRGADPRHQAVQARQPRDAPRRHGRSRSPQATIGPGTFTIIAGPCSVENEAMILRTAEFLVSQGREVAAGRGVQAADQPLRLPGHGRRGAGDPGRRPARRPASASSPS